MSRIKGFRYDFAAAFWFAVAYVGSAFAVYVVLIVGLAVRGSALDSVTAFVSVGIITSLIFGVTAYRLVRNEPWRRFPTTAITLYLMQLAAAAALGVVQFVQTPGQPLRIVATLVSPLTFGLVQINSFRPLSFGPPDVWSLVGLVVGFLLARRVLVREGRAVGADADIRLRPLRLPDRHELDGSAGR